MVCGDFPNSQKHIRRAAVYMAVRRSFATVADYVTDHFGDDFAMGASAVVKPKPKEKLAPAASPRCDYASKITQGINEMQTSSRLAYGQRSLQCSSTPSGELAEVMKMLQQQSKVLQSLADAYTGVAGKVTESNMSA